MLLFFFACVANEKLTFNRSFVVSLKYLVCVNKFQE